MGITGWWGGTEMHFGEATVGDPEEDSFLNS